MDALWGLLGLLFLTATAYANETISGGTAAIVLRTPSRVAVAIDSREVYRESKDGKIEVKSSCAQKIRTIGPYVAVVAGFSHGSNGYDALRIIADNRKPGDTLDDLIAMTKVQVGSNFTALLKRLKQAGLDIESFHRRDEAAVQIAFIGVESGATKTAVLELFVDDPFGNSPPRWQVKQCPGDCGSSTYAYLLGIHSDMHKALTSSGRPLGALTLNDMKSLVTLEAAAYPELVGGPLSTATINVKGASMIEPASCGNADGPQMATTVGMAAASMQETAEGIAGDSLNELLDKQLSRMSDLQCHRTVHRYMAKPGSTRHLDDIEFDVEMHTGGERYTQIKRNNKLYKDISKIPGSWSYGELAAVLRITRDALPTAGPVAENETQIRFHVPASQHEWYLSVKGIKQWLDISGSLVLENGEIRQIEWIGSNLSLQSGIQNVKLNVSFSQADIADKKFRVPDSSTFAVEYSDTMIGSSLDVSGFSNYRRLGSTAEIAYQ